MLASKLLGWRYVGIELSKEYDSLEITLPSAFA
jgi:hypothetical protein